MYNTLLDVPEKIREFYHEEVRREQVFEEDGVTPVLTEESYTYTDENGVEQTGTRLVPTYQDNTYVVENRRHDLKSWDEVKAVISNVKGKKDSFVDYCIGKAIELELFEYHDKYLEWYEELVKLQEEQAEYVEPTLEEIEQGAEVIDYPAKIDAHNAKEPVRPATTLEGWKAENYAILRKPAYGTLEEQLEMQFDGTWEEHILSTKFKYTFELDKKRKALKNKISNYKKKLRDESTLDYNGHAQGIRKDDVQDLKMFADDLRSTGTPDMTLYFRDGSSRVMTPDELDSLRQQALVGPIAEIYRKESVLCALVEGLNLSELESFDIEAEWQAA